MKFLWRSLEEQQKRRKFAGLGLGEEAIRYGLVVGWDLCSGVGGGSVLVVV